MQRNDFQPENSLVLPAIEDRIARLPPDLRPLGTSVRRHYARGANVRPDGTVQVARMPWMGPESFGLVLYPAAEPAWVRAFGERWGRPIPEAYARVLAAINGCFVFGLALYGLPPSLQDRAPRRDQALEPLDLGAANQYWAREYRDAGGEFHFGGRSLSIDENVGYFLAPDGNVRSRRKHGEVLREWTSIEELLMEELPLVEAGDRERPPGAPAPWLFGRERP
jgi:hypothetical protein